MEKQRIGIMGGTFNPIHYGHLLLAEWAKEAYGLQKVLFIPTGCSYLKREQGILPGEVRLRMVQLAIEGNPDFADSDIEILRQGDTYTYETLEALSKEYPDAELVFISGADCLLFIDHWVRPDLIFRYCTLFAVNRNEISLEEMEKKKVQLEEDFQAKIVLHTFPRIEISSSEIRRRLANGESIRYMVPEQVRRFIEAEHLYDTKGEGSQH